MAEIRATHRYPAPPERVFAAWLDPDMARRFAFHPRRRDDPRRDRPAVGGRFTFTDRRPDMGEVEHVGAYEAIERPRRLVFTFAVPQYDPAYTRVTLEFAAVDGGTELALTHEGVPPEYQDQTPKGWAMILEGLERALAG